MTENAEVNTQSVWSRVTADQWHRLSGLSDGRVFQYSPAERTIQVLRPEHAGPIDVRLAQVTGGSIGAQELEFIEQLGAGDRLFLEVIDESDEPEIPGWTVTARQGVLDLTGPKMMQRIHHTNCITPLTWNRILSWASFDADLELVIRRLLVGVFSHFGPPVADRFWVRLEQRCGADPKDAPPLVKHWNVGEADKFVGFLEPDHAAFKKLRVQTFLYRLSEIFRHSYGAGLDRLVGQETSQLMDRWRQNEAIDQLNLQVSRNWYKINDVRAALEFNGINLGMVREYDSFCYFQTHLASNNDI